MERNYFKQLNPLIKQYFNVLSQEIPDFLVDYIPHSRNAQTK